MTHRRISSGSSIRLQSSDNEVVRGTASACCVRRARFARLIRSVERGRSLRRRRAFGPEAQPWHSTPYQALPLVYVQNASLEIAWTRVVRERRSIAGDVLVPFLTEGYEGFDINDSYDWMVAERLLADGLVQLPTLGVVGSRR